MPDILAAAAAAPVAIFAFRDGRGRPIAVPVTPYVDGDHIVVTSTLAYIRKAELVRRDERVALLADGVHARARASVTADVDGDVFERRLLAQELEKYPPARALVQIPGYREALPWYFGRAIIALAAERAERREGANAATIITLDDDGFPSIAPIDVSPDEVMAAEGWHGLPGLAFDAAVFPGPASLLFHREDDGMSDLRWLRLEGEFGHGGFTVEARRGTLDAAPGNVDYEARAARARATMNGWEKAR